jgi:UDP-N-acetyl-D-mannosaminuronic acid dehydrogenase
MCRCPERVAAAVLATLEFPEMSRFEKLPSSLQDRNVCIVGLGYVGLTLAVAMADSGFNVFGVEVQKSVLDTLSKGEPHFFEPRLKDKLSRVIRKGTFRFGEAIDPTFRATTYVITVGTPLNKSGTIELRFIEQATAQVARVLRDGDLVILRSTVKIGTARNSVQRILAETGKSFEIAVCPERTLEGRALIELHELPQIIGADSSETRHRCSQLFSIMTPTTVTVSSLEAAELVKLTDNTYRDVTFAFANEIAKLCGKLGVSASEVISAGKLGYPRTNVALPGPVGGPCLEKDPHILAQSALELGVGMEITKAARLTNENQPDQVAQLLLARTQSQGNFPSAPRIAVVGLAFKGVPATDDLRGTMAKPIIERLAAHFPNARFVGFDPVASATSCKAFFGIDMVSDVQAAFTGADLVVIANNHPLFRSLDLPAAVETMNRGGIVYDFWNLYDDVAASMPAHVTYLALGSENIERGPVTKATVLPLRRMPPKTYIVTGGTGFIGAPLVKRLLKEGHTVRVIDNDLRGQARRLDGVTGKIELINCDVRDSDAVTKATRGADGILHLAALNGTENFYKRPELVLDVGVRGILAMLDASKANRIREFVLASSSEAYQTPPEVPTSEDVPLIVPDPWNPRYSYGGSKLISEVILANYNRDLLDRAMIFRPHNVYGPDMGFEHVLPQFAMRAHDMIQSHPTGAVPFEIQGDGMQTRSFVHINDFIDGLILILERGKNREVYHIGTEEEVTIKDMVGHVFAHFGRSFSLRHKPIPEGGTLRRCPSVQKLTELGYRPKMGLRQGVSELVGWYVDNAKLRPAQAAE